jgi:hypothetical protein
MPDLVGCAIRTAAEGVPIAAIARALQVPYDRVLHWLQRARKLGAIAEIPKPDWPPTQAVNERSPTCARSTVNEKSRSAQSPPEEAEFLCRHIFRLTNLEAGFLVVLLRTLFAEKEKLHAVIEQQRAHRPLRPLQQEVTDPKMVDVMICKLRKKLALIDPDFLVRTSWGKGYFLDQSVKDAVYRMLDVGVADLRPDPVPSQDPTDGRPQERPRDAPRHGKPGVAQG